MALLRSPFVWTALSFAVFALLVAGQGQQCYWGKGADRRGPSELIPCNGTGSTSACCLQGDTCISGNACYNYASGNLYQYGCTDIDYEDSTCPYKCGSKSPWVALEYCGSDTIHDTWTCHSPESCGCEWNITYDLLTLQGRQCQDMGELALVGLYAPTSLAPWVSLPPTAGGSTGYYSPTTISGTATWLSTAVIGYTPTPITQLATYKTGPSSQVTIFPGQTPGSATYAAAQVVNGTAIGTQTVEVSGSPTSPVGLSQSPPGGTFPSSPSPSSTVSSGLSTVAEIGIGVGIGVSSLALLGILTACVMARRIRRQRQDHQQQQQRPPSDPASLHNGVPQYPNQPPMQGFGWTQQPNGSHHQYYEASKAPHVTSSLPPATPTELANTEVRVPQELDSEHSGVSPEMSPSPGAEGSIRRLV